MHFTNYVIPALSRDPFRGLGIGMNVERIARGTMDPASSAG